MAPGTGAGPIIVIVSAVAGDDINNIAIANFLTMPSAIAGPNYNTWADAHFNSSATAMMMMTLLMVMCVCWRDWQSESNSSERRHNNQSFLVFAEQVPSFVEVCPARNQIDEVIECVNLSSIRGRSIRGETAV